MIKQCTALAVGLCLTLMGHVWAHPWENNPRYTNFQIHQQAVSAIDLDSIYVVKYEPPIYIIAGQQVMGTAYSGSAAHYGHFQWRYNYDTKVVEAYNPFRGTWYQLTGTSPDTIDKVFKKVYLISFYGPNPYAEANKKAAQEAADKEEKVEIKQATQADIRAKVDATARKTADKLDQKAAAKAAKEGKDHIVPTIQLPSVPSYQEDAPVEVTFHFNK